MDTVALLESLEKTDLVRGAKTRHDENFSVAETSDPYVATRIARISDASEGFGESAGSLFVVARGATGKSAFAEYASHILGAPLWKTDSDLAVGGAALDSKLSRFVHEVEIEESVSALKNPVVIVDALDEAEVRVSAQSWNEFKDSLVKFADLGVRFIVCGRALATHDVKKRFDEEGIQCSSWELQPFDLSQQRTFVDRTYQAKKGATSVESSAYIAARDALLANLSFSDVGKDQDNFAGYAPVLQAVATQLSEQPNLAARSSREKFSNIGQVIGSLVSIVDEIFSREQRKFALAVREKFEESVLTDLFTREEQAQMLLHRAGLADNPSVPECVEAALRDDYLEFRESQIKDHPFLSGSLEFGWSSSVFEGYCLALMEGEISSRREFFKAASKNPFFGVFMSELEVGETDAWGLSAVHSSLLAFVSSTVLEGVEATRSVSGKITYQENAYEYSGVLMDSGAMDEPIELVGNLKLGGSESGFLTYHGDLQNLEIDAPAGYVVVEPEDRAAYLGPRLFIDAEVLEIAAREVKLPATSTQGADLFVGIASEFVCPLPRINPRPAEGTEMISLVPKIDPFDLGKLQNIHPYPWQTFIRSFQLPFGEELREQASSFSTRIYKIVEALRVLSNRFGSSGMTVAGFAAKASLPRIRPESGAVLSILEDAGIIRTEGEMVHFEDGSDYTLFATPLTWPRNTAVGFQDLAPDQAEKWKQVILRISLEFGKRLQK